MSIRSKVEAAARYSQNLASAAAGVPSVFWGMGKAAAGTIDAYTPAPVKILGVVVGAALVGSFVAEKRWDYKEGLNKPVQNKPTQPMVNKAVEKSVQNKLPSKLVESKAVDKPVIYISRKEEPQIYISRKEEPQIWVSRKEEGENKAVDKPVIYVSRKEKAQIYISRKEEESTAAKPVIYISRKNEGKPVKNEGTEKSVNDKPLKKLVEKANHSTVKKFTDSASHEMLVKKALVPNNVAATFDAEHAHNNMQEPAYVEVSVLGSEG